MFTPRSEAELAEFLRATTTPQRIVGGGTRAIGALQSGDHLGTTGLSGVKLYEPGSLTLVVGAGTTLDEVEKVLDEGNQRLAFEPMDHRGVLGTSGAPTIGGAVAANVSGPRRIQAGALRDSLLGVRFVDGQGTIIKNGGRVMKNVTGYDLVKLMAGSWGTLGVLSEVSLKVMPKPEATATLLVMGLSDQDAVRAMSAALGSPFDVTGAAHDPKAGQTYIRIEGFTQSVSYRSEQLVSLLSKFGETTALSDPAENIALWAGIRDVVTFDGAAGDVWRISVKPSDAPKLVEELGALQVQYDWGGGLVWALMPEGADLRAKMGAKGHATYVRGTADFARFHPENEIIARLSAEVRKKFDPKGILNTGFMG